MKHTVTKNIDYIGEYMKGFMEEMLWYVVIILAVFMLFVFFMYQRGTAGIQARRTVESRVLDEEGTIALFSLFTNKLPFVGRTTLQAAIDAVLQGASSGKEKNKAFYGAYLGTVNVTEVIKPLFDRYVGKKWNLEIKVPNGTYVYGYEIDEDDVIYMYESIIPVPEELVGYVKLRIGKSD